MTPLSKAEWEAGIDALHLEANGVLEIWPVLVTDVPRLIASSRSGNAEAFHILRSINTTILQMQSGPEDEPPMCGCCSRLLNEMNFSFVVVTPAERPADGHALSMAICLVCGPNREAVRTAGTLALQELWPDARPFTMTHKTGGRA